jgi:hypothetical protein
MLLCNYPGCTREALAGCRYCRFCQKKGTLRDYRRQSSLHAAALSARAVDPNPVDLLLAFCAPSEREFTHTYAIGVHGAVKFGQSTRIPSRLEALQIGSHRRLRVLGEIHSSRSLALYIHSALRTHLIRGEWFRLDEASRGVIRSMRANDLPSLCRLLSEMISLTDKKVMTQVARHTVAIHEMGPVLV